MSSEPARNLDASEVSYIPSQAGLDEPKRMDWFSKSKTVLTTNPPPYDSKKAEQIAKISTNSGQNSPRKSAYTNKVCKISENVKFNPQFDPKKIDPIAKPVTNSSTNQRMAPSLKTPEIPVTSTTMSTGSGVSLLGNTKTGDAKITRLV